MASEDDTTKIKREPKDVTSVIVGALAFAVGGGTGTVGTLAVTKASVDRLTVQVEKLEDKVESLLIDRWTRAEQREFQDRMEREMDKLREELRRKQ
jgi:hypothetical protein